MDKPDTLVQDYHVPTDVATVARLHQRWIEDGLTELLSQLRPGHGPGRPDVPPGLLPGRRSSGTPPSPRCVWWTPTGLTTAATPPSPPTSTPGGDPDQRCRPPMTSYLAAREEVYGQEKADQRPQTLMDIGHHRRQGAAKSGACCQNLDESEEINACSIHIPVDRGRQGARTGCSCSRTRPTTTPPRSNPSAARPPASAVPSVTPCPAGPMSTRPCASPAAAIPSTPDERDPARQAAPAQAGHHCRRRLLLLRQPDRPGHRPWWQRYTTPAMWPSTWRWARWWALPRPPTVVREAPAPGDVVDPAGRPHRPGRHRRRHRLLQEPQPASP